MNYYNAGMYMPSVDRINKQIEDLQNLKSQMQNPMQMPNSATPAINQTFQLANTNNMNDFDGKYANNVDEVKNTLALRNMLFVNKEMNILWLKDVTGNIKSYTLTEIVELDEKDKKIIELEKQIESMKGMILNAKSNNVNVDEPIAKSKSTNVPNDKSSKE